MKIETVTHFAKYDKDCSGDYYSVDVKINGKIVRHYSDHYHDKGAEKAEAFIDGFKFALNKHDGEYVVVEIETHKASGKT